MEVGDVLSICDIGVAAGLVRTEDEAARSGRERTEERAVRITTGEVGTIRQSATGLTKRIEIRTERRELQIERVAELGRKRSAV